MPDEGSPVNYIWPKSSKFIDRISEMRLYQNEYVLYTHTILTIDPSLQLYSPRVKPVSLRLFKYISLMRKFAHQISVAPLAIDNIVSILSLGRIWVHYKDLCSPHRLAYELSGVTFSISNNLCVFSQLLLCIMDSFNLPDRSLVIELLHPRVL